MFQQLKTRSLMRFLVLSALLLLLVGVAAAGPGDPDPGFGGDGIVTTTLSLTADYGYGVAVQPDGKLIVAGVTGTNPFQDFAVTRYNPDGSPDLTFGSTGAAFVDFGGDSDTARAAVVQPDGKIVVAGHSYDGANINFALARLNADGSLDTTFGGGLGYVTTDFSSDNDRGLDVLLQDDGKIIVTGDSRNGPNLNYALARYNPDGSLDNSFDGDGRVTTDFGGQDFGRKSVLQDDGKIIMVGEASLAFGLARYNPDGSLDNSFDGDGKVTTTFAGLSDYGEDVIVGPAGEIVAVGRVYNGADFDMGVAKYNLDGSLDNSFHFDGRQVIDLGAGESAYAVQVQANGKVLIGGGSNLLGSFDFALVRLNSDGTLDGGFGFGGSSLVEITSGNDTPFDMLLQPDGRPVLAGYAEEDGDFNFALARFQPDGQLDPDFDTGKVITDFNQESDSIRALAVQDDGKIVAAGRTFNGADFDFALARYNPDGSLDNSFGANGLVSTDIIVDDAAEAVLVQADGKIVAAGYTFNGANYDFALARYNPDGSLDNTFGFGGLGVAWMDFGGGYDQGFGVAQQADGKYLVGGVAQVGGNMNFGVGRFLEDGSFDFGFDGDARVDVDFGSTDFGRDLILQPDGKFILAGRAFTGGDFDFALARLNSDGSLDNTFHFDGRVTTDINGDEDFGEAAQLYPDGDIIVAGSTQVGLEDDFALIRYNTDGSLDAGFGSGGVTITDLGVDDYALGLAVRPDGKIAAGGTSLYGPGFDFTMALYHPDGSLDTTFGDEGRVRTDFARQDDNAFAVAYTDGTLLLGGVAYQAGSNQFALARYQALNETYLPIILNQP